MKRLVEEYLGFEVLRSKIERLQNVGSASSLVSVDASQMIVVGVVAVETTRSEQNSERGDGDRLSLSALIGMEECEQTTFLGAFPPLGAFTLGFLGGTPCFGAAFWAADAAVVAVLEAASLGAAAAFGTTFSAVLAAFAAAAVAAGFASVAIRL